MATLSRPDFGAVSPAPPPVFSEDGFLEAIRAVYRRGSRTAFVECEGEVYRTLVRAGRSALNGLWEFPLYLEPVAPPASAARRVPYMDSVCLMTLPVGAKAPPGLTPAPFTDWRGFCTWESYLASRSPAQGSDGFDTLARKRRKLERELGPVEVCMDDPSDAVLETLIGWKSAQYRRTGLPDKFARPRNRDFLDELRRRGLLSVSTLRAGGRLLAGALGHRTGGRYLSRLPAYDPAFARYSPGSLLHFENVKASYERGDSEFNALIGGEAYKFTYATHVRWIGAVGREPLRDMVVRRARNGAGMTIRRSGLDSRLHLRLKRAGRPNG